MPAPGGGATAALHAAQGAALLGMVARYTTGQKYAEHQVTIARIIAEADDLRGIALLTGQKHRLVLGNRDLRSQTAEGLCQLTPQRSAADDDEARRSCLQVEDGFIGPITRLLKTWDLRP